MKRSLGLGVLLIVLGAVFLLRNLGIVYFPHWFFSWQMLLIGLGIFNLVAGRRTPGFVLLGVGGLFLLKEIYYFRIGELWPAFLIIVGLVIIFRKRQQEQTLKSGLYGDGYFDILNVFSGGTRVISSEQLEGGRVTAIFGGGELDLTQTTPGPGATVEILCLFGGCSIIVPQDWDVQAEITSIFGGFEDNRRHINVTSESPKLIIKGQCIFGGGDLKY